LAPRMSITMSLCIRPTAFQRPSCERLLALLETAPCCTAPRGCLRPWGSCRELNNFFAYYEPAGLAYNSPFRTLSKPLQIMPFKPEFVISLCPSAPPPPLGKRHCWPHFPALHSRSPTHGQRTQPPTWRSQVPAHLGKAFLSIVICSWLVHCSARCSGLLPQTRRLDCTSNVLNSEQDKNKRTMLRPAPACEEVRLGCGQRC